jgi:phosphonate transport system substrate-binding protein
MTGQPTLKAVSYLAPNWFGFYQTVTEALARSLAIEIQLQQGECDPLEDPLLLHDQLDLAFICGLPFIRHYKVAPDQLQVLAAPVMQAGRYHNQPIYFADVIVNAASNLQCVEELVGKTFCYNDRGSNSGYNLVHWYLLNKGDPTDFWGACVQSGSHLRSLQWVIEGQADWAVIDSTVLERALAQHPEFTQNLRVIEAIGPSPMPPIVAATHLGTGVLQQLQSTLLYPDQELQTAMANMRVQHYDLRKWQDYQILAEIYEAVLSGRIE